MLAIHNLFGFYSIEPQSAQTYIHYIASYLKGENTGKRFEPVAQSLRQAASPMQLAHTAYNVGPRGSEWEPGWIEDDCVAIIAITGVITKYSSCEGPGMQMISNYLLQCYANEHIKGIILNIDTCGGQASAMRLLSDTLKMRNKGIIAFINDSCYSGGMGIACACDTIIANNDFAECGSIGTMCTLLDERKKLEQEGINVIELYATASKDKNKDFRDALDGKTESYIKRLDAVNEAFLAHVESGRNGRLTTDRKIWGTGKTFPAPEAVEIGLIDGIDSLDNVIGYFDF